MDKKLIALTLVLLSLAAVTFITKNQPEKTIKQIYQEWKSVHGLMKDLTEQEDSYRLKIFQDNYRVINQHNSLLGRSYDMGVNQFSAYTDEEFAKLRLTTFEPLHKFSNQKETSISPLTINIDWVAAGAVTPVKNQGNCISTYAFSAIGAIEGISFIFYKNRQEYSVQQLVDCSQSYGNHGCTTGTMYSSFNYITAKGITTEGAYPYVAKLQSCKVQTGFFRINGYSNATSCDDLDKALMIRPISVAVDGQYFRNYHSGIFDNCGSNLNLAALLVGATDSYYNLKNSWGYSWGESGYIRLTKRFNVCGICQAASYPIPG